MDSLLSINDQDIGWTFALTMKLCVCDHRQKSHRPMSGRCVLCDCKQFRDPSPKERKERRYNDRRKP